MQFNLVLAFQLSLGIETALKNAIFFSWLVITFRIIMKI